MKMQVMTAWIVLGGITMGATVLTSGPAVAQIVSPQSLPGSQPQDQSYDLLSDSNERNGADILNLINQIQLLKGWNPDEFAAEQSGNLDAAAAEFRTRQLEQIQIQPQPNPSQVDLAPAP